jgi:hypothetical protein
MILWIKESRIIDNVLHGLAARSYDRSFYEKIIASLGPFLEKLTSGAVGKLISPDYFDPKTPPHLRLDDGLPPGRHCLCRPGCARSVVSSAVGNSMLSDLVSLAASSTRPASTRTTRTASSAAQRLLPLR